MSAITEQVHIVRGMSCSHCERAVAEEIEQVPGVSSIDVELTSGRVLVHGRDVDREAVRLAIARAGYEAER